MADTKQPKSTAMQQDLGGNVPFGSGGDLGDKANSPLGPDAAGAAAAPREAHMVGATDEHGYATSTSGMGGSSGQMAGTGKKEPGKSNLQGDENRVAER